MFSRKAIWKQETAFGHTDAVEAIRSVQLISVAFKIFHY